ncbi:Scarecrow-like protein 14 [Morella rubra]|uniref:Scarecrow-like protein 14 n=1 Tax=Morella rubra TaxID=262757 RepID=A0A6A1V164_9ROSI|nr:Scarecrow-like protein 14 [Morella rubra]
METLLEGFTGSIIEFMFNRRSARCSNGNLGNGFKVDHELLNPPFLPTNPQNSGESSPSSGASLEGDSQDSGGFKVNHELLNPPFLPTNPQHSGESSPSSGLSLEGDSQDSGGFKVNHELLNPPFLPTNPQHSGESSPSSGLSLEGDSQDSGDFSNVCLKYINEMLMDEDLETKPCMLQDCLALQAAEKSFYEALGQEYPPSSSQPCLDQNTESPDDSFGGGSSIDLSNSSAAADFLFASSCLYDQGEPKFSCIRSDNLLVADSFSGIQSVLQVKGGIPVKPLQNGNCEIIHLEIPPFVPEEQTRTVVAMAENTSRSTSPNESRWLKNHQREDSDDLEDGRSNKHSAVYAGDSEPLEMFDEILLCPGGVHDSLTCTLHESTGSGGSRTLQHNGHSGGSNAKSTRSRSKVRLAGTRTPVYTPLVSNGTSAAAILKAYKVYVTACPFKRMSNFFANRTIRKLAESQKATRIHIIDFGILYGFQWPCLIQRLSERPGGPPRLRVTGIELPQPGFRPAERVEETGRRLEKYCLRFNVPFEYNVIAQKWETIRLEDLKLERDELVVVNSLYRLRNIPDETLVVSSPRDTVLKLIRRINPRFICPWGSQRDIQCTLLCHTVPGGALSLLSIVRYV